MLRLASDERLVDMVRAESRPAFEVIYDRHHRGILSFCRHMLGSQEEAEDALQHTFMAAYRDMAGSTKPIQLRAWLYAIARNRCLTVLRARREHPSDDIEEASVLGLSEEVQQRQDLRDMLADLHELPEDQRAALVLSELGAMSHEEIGTVVGCRPEKVRALVFQARASLIASREARDTSCQEIREELSTLRGGSLRRTHLRRHLKQCAGCRAFRADVDRQRRAMAAVLPVIPALGLRESALAAAFGAGSAGHAAAGGAVAAGIGSAAGGTAAAGGAPLAAKVLAAVVLAAGGTAGGVAAVDAVRNGGGGSAGGGAPASAPAPGGPSSGAVPAAPQSADPSADPTTTPAARAQGKTDRGKEHAKTRGKGNKRGLNGTQPGRDRQGGPEKDKRAKDRAQPDGRGKTAKPKIKRSKPQRTVSKRPKRRAKVKPQPAPQPTATPRPAPTPKPRPDPKPRPEPTPPPPAPTVDPIPTVPPEDASAGARRG